MKRLALVLFALTLLPSSALADDKRPFVSVSYAQGIGQDAEDSFMKEIISLGGGFRFNRNFALEAALDLQKENECLVEFGFCLKSDLTTLWVGPRIIFPAAPRIDVYFNFLAGIYQLNSKSILNKEVLAETMTNGYAGRGSVGVSFRLPGNVNIGGEIGYRRLLDDLEDKNGGSVFALGNIGIGF